MKDRKLAARYARALLSIFSDPSSAEATDRFLGSLRSALERSPEFRDLMLDPSFSLASRKAVLRSLVERAGVSGPIGKFLDTVVDNNRASSLPSIAEVFHEEYEKKMGVVPAEITTAAPLSEEQRQRAGAAVQKLTGRQVRLSCHVEPEILGGAVTRIGSTIYDGSLRTQLNQLRRKMTQE